MVLHISINKYTLSCIYKLRTLVVDCSLMKLKVRGLWLSIIQYLSTDLAPFSRTLSLKPMLIVTITVNYCLVAPYYTMAPV